MRQIAVEGGLGSLSPVGSTVQLLGPWSMVRAGRMVPGLLVSLRLHWTLIIGMRLVRLVGSRASLLVITCWLRS